jgi:hypothetical protein
LVARIDRGNRSVGDGRPEFASALAWGGRSRVAGCEPPTSLSEQSQAPSRIPGISCPSDSSIALPCGIAIMTDWSVGDVERTPEMC